MTSNLSSRHRGANEELLKRYDDLDQPLATEEQEKIIAELKAKNDSSNYVYRALVLIMISLVLVLYLTPIPSYIKGTHPENHLVLFHHGVHVVGTEEHLTYLPAFPIYLIFFGIQGYCLYLAGVEVLALMGHASLASKLKGQSSPAVYQSHPFGTAPSWIVPLLSDLRYTTGNKVNLHERADQPAAISSDSKAVSDALSSPRLLYLWAVFIASLPLPLLVFGAGNFSNAGWFAFTSGVLGVNLAIETWIRRSEKDLLGLDGLKYDHKSA
ncbi:hypothetical protein BCV70DRAFT_229006 [Testicularia cyperi]|uniref:Uncharacterized protein n=1 Tax=Testicularia cyperi TaxID=1882483 RepID=A0A317XW81_9BASI|nr:hypothetical protein BCV70DRAFT_229006 [Testicularia cyperi]